MSDDNRKSRPARRQRRGIYLASRLLLSAATLALALVVVEVGFRVYYHLADVPTTITYSSNDQYWKQRWIERHRDEGLEIAYGYDRYDPILGWALRPNLRQYKFDDQTPITTNAQGWRCDRDFSYGKPEGVTRIVVLGDSFTFGENETDQAIWPVQLERQLDGVEVLNLAVHGYGTDRQLLALEQEGVKYHPDVVVLGCFVPGVFRNGLAFRDYAKPMFVLADGKVVLTNVPVPKPEQLLAREAGAKPLSYVVYHFRNRLLGRFGSGDLDAVARNRQLLPLTKAILQRMVGVTESVEAKLLLVVIPGPRAPMPKVRAALNQWAGQVGYAVLDLGGPFDEAERKYEKPMYFRHFSRLGHLVAAAAVRESLVELGWLSPPSEQTLAAAQRRLQQVLDQHEPDAQEYFSFAMRLARHNGRIDEAMRNFRRAIELDPTHASAYNELALLCIETGQVDEAERLFRRAIELKPADAILRANLGTAFNSAGGIDEALQQLRRAVELDPNLFVAHNFIGVICNRNGRFDEALVALRRAVRLRAEVAEVHYQLGIALAGLGSVDQAIAAFERAVQLNGRHVKARGRLRELLAGRDGNR